MAEQKTVKKQYTDAERADYRKKIQERKLVRAGEDNTQVVNTSTFEAADTSQFIDKIDYVMKRLRSSFGSRSSKVSAADFELISGQITSINNLVNFLLSKTNKIAGIPYRPPRGFLDLTKQSSLDRAGEQLDTIIEQLMNEREYISAQIVTRDARLAKEAETAAAKKTAAAVAATTVTTPTKKAPAKAKADAGGEAQAEAA